MSEKKFCSVTTHRRSYKFMYDAIIHIFEHIKLRQLYGIAFVGVIIGRTCRVPFSSFIAPFALENDNKEFPSFLSNCGESKKNMSIASLRAPASTV